MVQNYYSIHELSITCIEYYEPYDYLITGGKEGSICIRNARKAIIFEFKDHFNAITGLLLMEKVCAAPSGTLPILVSCSLDATIRTCNFETGQSLYRIDLTEACLGLGWMKQDQFYHFGASKIQTWNVNRYENTFAFFRSTPLFIRRVECPGKPDRILTATKDGSIKLLSTSTGISLATGFPTHKDVQVAFLGYDMKNEMIYCLTVADTLISYDTRTNPFKIIETINLLGSTLFLFQAPIIETRFDAVRNRACTTVLLPKMFQIEYYQTQELAETTCFSAELQKVKFI